MYSSRYKKVKVQYRTSTALDSTSNSTAPIVRQYRAISFVVQYGAVRYGMVQCCVL